MNDKGHHIYKQIIQLDYDEEDSAGPMQQRWSDFCNHDLLQMMNGVFDRLFPGNALIKIQRLNIDTGLLHRQQSNKEWLDIIEAQLEKELAIYIQQPGNQSSEKAASETPIIYQDDDLHLFNKYLLTGNLPAWVNANKQSDLIPQLIKRLLQQNRQHLLATLKKTGKNPVARKRLYLQMPEQILNELIALLEPANSGKIEQVVSVLALNHPRSDVYSVIFDYLLARETSSHFSLRALLGRLRSDLSRTGLKIDETAFNSLEQKFRIAPSNKRPVWDYRAITRQLIQTGTFPPAVRVSVKELELFWAMSAETGGDSLLLSLLESITDKAQASVNLTWYFSPAFINRVFKIYDPGYATSLTRNVSILQRYYKSGGYIMVNHAGFAKLITYWALLQRLVTGKDILDELSFFYLLTKQIATHFKIDREKWTEAVAQQARLHSAPVAFINLVDNINNGRAAASSRRLKQDPMLFTHPVPDLEKRIRDNSDAGYQDDEDALRQLSRYLQTGQLTVNADSYSEKSNLSKLMISPFADTKQVDHIAITEYIISTGTFPPDVNISAKELQEFWAATTKTDNGKALLAIIAAAPDKERAKKELIKHILPASYQQYVPEIKDAIASGHEFDILSIFLQSGTLPVQADSGYEKDHITRLVVQLLQQSPAQLLVLLKRIGKKKVVSQRLAAQLPAQVLDDIIGLLAPANTKNIIQLISVLSTVYPLAAVYQSAIHYLLVTKPVSFNFPALLLQMRSELRKAHSEIDEDRIDQLVQELYTEDNNVQTSSSYHAITLQLITRGSLPINKANVSVNELELYWSLAVKTDNGRALLSIFDQAVNKAGAVKNIIQFFSPAFVNQVLVILYPEYGSSLLENLQLFRRYYKEGRYITIGSAGFNKLSSYWSLMIRLNSGDNKIDESSFFSILVSQAAIHFNIDNEKWVEAILNQAVAEAASARFIEIFRAIKGMRQLAEPPGLKTGNYKELIATVHTSGNAERDKVIMAYLLTGNLPWWYPGLKPEHLRQAIRIQMATNSAYLSDLSHRIVRNAEAFVRLQQLVKKMGLNVDYLSDIPIPADDHAEASLRLQQQTDVAYIVNGKAINDQAELPVFADELSKKWSLVNDFLAAKELKTGTKTSQKPEIIAVFKQLYQQNPAFIIGRIKALQPDVSLVEAFSAIASEDILHEIVSGLLPAHDARILKRILPLIKNSTADTILYQTLSRLAHTFFLQLHSKRSSGSPVLLLNELVIRYAALSGISHQSIIKKLYKLALAAQKTKVHLLFDSIILLHETSNSKTIRLKPAASEYIDEFDTEVEMLIYFLKNFSWTETSTAFDPRGYIQQLHEKFPHRLQSLLVGLLKSRAIRQHLVNHTNDLVILEIIQSLYPANGAIKNQLINTRSWLSIPQKFNLPGSEFWLFTLGYVQGKNLFSLFDYTYQLTEYISGNQKINHYLYLKQQLLLLQKTNDKRLQGIAALLRLIKKQNQADRSEKSTTKMAETAETEMPGDNPEDDQATDLFINNAGIVITHTFIRPYLERLGLLTDGKFQKMSDRFKAMDAIQYLVNGDDRHQEYNLVLNKLLCGVDITEVYEPQPPLSQQHKEVADSLLLHIIQLWKIIGNTSIDGLRESFFQRNGKLLLAEDAIHLQVEQKAFDVLLDQLPWGINIINFSWMPKAIHVSWR